CEPVPRAVGDRAATRRAGYRDHRDPDVRLLLERISVRAVVHGHARAPDSPGRGRAVPQLVPDPVGPDPRGDDRDDAPHPRAGRGVPAPHPEWAHCGLGEVTWQRYTSRT